MTLNITIASPRLLYQCADYRLFDLQANRPLDLESQKVFQIVRNSWHASVCFAGIGRTREIDVGAWLAARLASLEQNSSFEQLIDELLDADAWLASVPEKHRHHSFNIGAFVGSEPTYVRISNFEDLSGPISSRHVTRLKIHRVEPQRTLTFVSGQSDYLDRATRLRLARLVDEGNETSIVVEALVQANRNASRQTNKVSYACFTTHLAITGQGSGMPHDVDPKTFTRSTGMLPIGAEIEKLLKAQFGPGGGRIRQMSYGMSRPTEEFHRTQLKEKPNDPHTHSNYGAYLQDTVKDVVGAERAYLRALELDPAHANARGNLSNILWRRGEHDAAESGYLRVLESDPNNENVLWNYSDFLGSIRADYIGALGLVDRGLVAHPHSGRMAIRGGDLCLRLKRPAEAFDYYTRGRNAGGDQTMAECGRAVALHMMWGDLDECIAAYRVAMSVRPNDADLELNLAQLLFLKGYGEEAESRLAKAFQLGLTPNAKLEAQFYALAHTRTEPQGIVSDIKALTAGGARLDWNVAPNIAFLRDSDQAKADVLQALAEELAGEARPQVIESVLQALLHS